MAAVRQPVVGHGRHAWRKTCPIQTARESTVGHARGEGERRRRAVTRRPGISRDGGIGRSRIDVPRVNRWTAVNIAGGIDSSHAESVTARRQCAVANRTRTRRPGRRIEPALEGAPHFI